MCVPQTSNAMAESKLSRVSTDIDLTIFRPDNANGRLRYDHLSLAALSKKLRYQRDIKSQDGQAVKRRRRLLS